MGQELRVSIIGDSVLVEGIVISLENNSRTKVQHTCTANNDTLHRIAEFNPEVIIYPLGLPEVETIISQARMKPGVRLIGLDMECNQVLVMDSHLHRMLSLEDLQQLIAANGLDLFESVESDLPEQGQNSRERVLK